MSEEHIFDTTSVIFALTLQFKGDAGRTISILPLKGLAGIQSLQTSDLTDRLFSPAFVRKHSGKIRWDYIDSNNCHFNLQKSNSFLGIVGDLCGVANGENSVRKLLPSEADLNLTSALKKVTCVFLASIIERKPDPVLKQIDVGSFLKGSRNLVGKSKKKKGRVLKLSTVVPADRISLPIDYDGSLHKSVAGKYDMSKRMKTKIFDKKVKQNRGFVLSEYGENCQYLPPSAENVLGGFKCKCGFMRKQCTLKNLTPKNSLFRTHATGTSNHCQYFKASRGKNKSIFSFGWTHTKESAKKRNADRKRKREAKK